MDSIKYYAKNFSQETLEALSEPDIHLGITEIDPFVKAHLDIIRICLTEIESEKQTKIEE